MTIGSCNVESFGARGDGIADDTAALQRALNTVQTGGLVTLTAGHTYNATNLQLPTQGGPFNDFACAGFVSLGGSATLRQLPQGDTRYFVATERWITGAGYADRPWRVENIVFDADNTADYTFVLKSWASQFTGCEFRGGKLGAFLSTRQNLDGSLGTSEFLTGNIWTMCRFQGGFFTRGPDNAPSQAPTDGTLLSCFITNGLLSLANCGGWTVTACRTFGDNAGAVFDNVARGFICTSNNFDGSAGITVLKLVSAYPYARLGPGNAYYVPLSAQFTDNASVETLCVTGESFWSKQNGATPSYISHANNRASKTVVSHGNTFLTTDPHRLAPGNTLGTYRVEGGLDGNGALPYA